MIKLKRIDFSHNWNGKLDNEFFTTIRKFMVDKLRYYHGSIGETFGVFLNGEKVCEARLEIADLFKLNRSNIYDKIIVMLDTGLPHEKAFDLLAKFGCEHEGILLLFKRLEE